ncbi:MAG: hypothetical protein KBC66_03185 [Kiritimatiellae bacterium]|jgi:hypothetical protein|nr:hypothetical protein [Kiritimatiellia bacterium]NLD90240.1 hypothetical protein [Lentisphaerota bacterium]HPC19053.1 hypothetical protein [Kiritimatiellia bacterium]HQN79758.1 hypothetical protein [Kiritimatiellia bacterium]HQQ61059.1 hypothetical protein [Kiritimatiellia bacterium]
MRFTATGRVWLFAALAVTGALAQVPLPAAWTGPWQYGAPPDGWFFYGLGVDYTPGYDSGNDGAAKFDGTGDHIAIHYAGPAGTLSYWVKGLTFSGGVFRVEQSADGLEWTDLAVYVAPPTNATLQMHFPAPATRHIRFLYAEKVHGNVGIDGISIGALVYPVIESLAVTGGVVRAALAESTTGRTYALEHAGAIAPAPAQWLPCDTQTGTGGELELRDPAPADTVRFYRVRDVTP